MNSMSLNYVYVIYFTLTACMRLILYVYTTGPQEIWTTIPATMEAFGRDGRRLLQRRMPLGELNDLSCNDGYPWERWTTSPATIDSDGRPLLKDEWPFFTRMNGRIIYVDYVNLSKIKLKYNIRFWRTLR